MSFKFMFVAGSGTKRDFNTGMIRMTQDELDELNRRMHNWILEDEGKFKVIIDFENHFPVSMEFTRFGTTAAAVVWSQEGNDGIVHFRYGASLFMPKLDADEEHQAAEFVCTSYDGIEGLNMDRFQQAFEMTEPVVVTYFPDADRGSYPPLHRYIKAAGVTFLEQLAKS